MNAFDIRYVKEQGMFRGEFRLSHWAGYKAVMDSDGDPQMFAHPLDAHKAATNEFLRLLNSVPAYTGIMSNDSARKAAEAYFRGKKNGESEAKAETDA